TEIRDGEKAYRVVFRLPNGEDQETVVARAAESAESVDLASEWVVRRCVEQVTSADGKKLAHVPPVILHELTEKMGELDPQAEILLDLACPECEAGFVMPFDVANYVCRELATSQREFYREVHALSFHYHWDEKTILELTRHKRHIYLDLLASELAGGG